MGYNNNVPFRGKTYHVQTEDSGTRRSHVVTHLFADGGRVISTMKTSYAHYVENDRAADNNLSERVRALMVEQHKRMMLALRDGELDHLLSDAKSTRRQPPRTIGDSRDTNVTHRAPKQRSRRKHQTRPGGSVREPAPVRRSASVQEPISGAQPTEAPGDGLGAETGFGARMLSSMPLADVILTALARLRQKRR